MPAENYLVLVFLYALKVRHLVAKGDQTQLKAIERYAREGVASTLTASKHSSENESRSEAKGIVFRLNSMRSQGGTCSALVPDSMTVSRQKYTKIRDTVHESGSTSESLASEKPWGLNTDPHMAMESESELLVSASADMPLDPHAAARMTFSESEPVDRDRPQGGRMTTGFSESEPVGRDKPQVSRRPYKRRRQANASTAVESEHVRVSASELLLAMPCGDQALSENTRRKSGCEHAKQKSRCQDCGESGSCEQGKQKNR